MARDATGLAGLEAELAGFRDLLGVLRAEQDALRRADADALSPLVPCKLTLLAALERLARTRHDAMRTAGFPATRAGIDAWLAHMPQAATAKACFRELLALAWQARALNASSRRLAAAQCRHFERAGAALRRAAGQDDVYGADGRTQRHGAQRALAEI